MECHATITKYQMSADSKNYNLQNVECQSLVPSWEISSRSPRFAKRAISNLGNVLNRPLYLQQISARVWFKSRLRHNTFRQPGLPTFSFRFIVYHNRRESSIHSACNRACF